MGSGHSKTEKEGEKDGKRGKTPSPNQEKHNSADSKAPLTEHAANFAFPRTLSLDRNISLRGNAPNLSRSRTLTADEDQIRVASQKSPIIPVFDSPISVAVHDIEGHSNVSRPPPPPRLRHLSELIDPEELAIDSQIRSPSGNLLAPEQFLAHPNRPRSIRERQEQIREKVRAASRLGVEAENAESEKPSTEKAGGKKKKAKRGRFGCCCF